MAETQTNNQSETIRADRNRDELVLVEQQAGGGFGYEFRYAEYDDLIEGALFNTYTAAEEVTGVDLFVNADHNSIESTSTDLSGFVAGQWVKVSGFTNSDNVGYFLIDENFDPTTDKIVIDATRHTLVDEVASPSVTIKNDSMLRNGIARRGFTFVKHHGSTTQYFFFNGMLVNTWSLNFTQGAKPGGDFDFVGFASSQGTSQIAGATVNDPSTNPIFNSVSNIGTFTIDGTETGSVRNLSFTVSNNLEALFALGDATAVDVIDGSIDVTGSFEVYFQNATIYNKWKNSGTFNLDFDVTDNDGNVYIVSIPNFKFNNLRADATGINTSVVLTGDFTASYNSETACTIQLDKFDA